MAAKMHTFAVGESHVDQVLFTPHGCSRGVLSRCAIDLADVLLVGQNAVWVELVTRQGHTLQLRTEQAGVGDYSNASALWADVAALVETAR